MSGINALSAEVPDRNRNAGECGRVELLAPGGSMESIRAAVNAGADAVYAGGRLFGARAFADNPETEALLEAIDYCHLHGVKLYLTVNTLLKEYELTQMLPEFLAPIYEHGVDAVLVQDFGVFHFLRKTFPDLPIHASTQMTITGPDGALLLKEMGAERVVLSRELSLEEIRSIRSRTDVELETFVHGALCYCYSGKCLMSSMIGGRSGNRGRCAQPCRLPWDFYEKPQDVRSRRSLNDRSQQYLLSPKDICTLRLLPDLIDAGIKSLKIEGRMKSPEYAAGVTAIYRRYIDLYLEKGREGFRVEEADEKWLAKLFTRGDFSEGYYLKRNGSDMMLLQEKTERKGDDLRDAQAAVSGIRKMYVETSRKIPLRAQVSIHAGKSAEMTLTCLRKAGLYADRDNRMEGSGQGSPEQGSEQDILRDMPESEELTLTVQGFVPTPARSRPADRETVLKQIGKTGNTDFEFESIEIDLEDGLFVQVRDLNELRRNALDAMRRELLSPYRRQFGKSGSDMQDRPDPASVSAQKRESEMSDEADRAAVHVTGLYMGGYKHISHPPVTASVCTQEQLEAVLSDQKVGGVYLDLPVCTAANVSMAWNSGRKVYLMLPGIWREDTAGIVRGRMEREFGAFSPKMKASLDGILVCCYDQLHALKDADLLNAHDGFEVIADASLYTWNRSAREELSRLGVTMDTLPFECSQAELSERGCENSECVIYGYQTLMQSAQCLLKTTSGCGRNGNERVSEADWKGTDPAKDNVKRAGVRYLRDRKGILFPVKNDCLLCLNTIYNSVPLELVSLSAQLKQLSPASVRYLFTIEDKAETQRILRGKLPDAVTRGHFRKGVE